jgi:hypothetical protein
MNPNEYPDSGDPLISPTAQPIPDEVIQQAQVRNQARLEGLILAALSGALVALVIAVIAGIGVLLINNHVDAQDARITASDVERARADAQLRDGICKTVLALRGTSSTALRDAWPTGTGPFDQFYAQINAVGVGLKCDAG